MATINLGRVGLVQKGDWQAGVTYQMLDVVRYNGARYGCKVPSTTATPSDDTKWELWVSDGAVGPQGPAGVAGVAGSTGFIPNSLSSPYEIDSGTSGMAVGTIVVDSTLIVSGNLGII